jgi:tetratricopeptide (TPR) repeat protein
LGNDSAAILLVEESVRVAEGIDEELLATVLSDASLAYQAIDVGDLVKASAAHTRALDIARRINHRRLISRTLLRGAELHTTKGELEQALALATEAKAIADDLRDQRQSSMTSLKLGEIRLRAGQYARAANHLRDALPSIRRTGREFGVADASSSPLGSRPRRDSQNMPCVCMRRRIASIQ